MATTANTANSVPQPNTGADIVPQLSLRGTTTNRNTSAVSAYAPSQASFDQRKMVRPS